MVAYRAGRVPRYYVICPVYSGRATSDTPFVFALPLKRHQTPSSIG